MRTASLVFALVLLLAPAACKKEIKTMTLLPDSRETLTYNLNDHASFSCFPFTCFNTLGTKCPNDVDSATEIQVGYDYNYHNGTPPCNCWSYVDCVYRGGVRFNLDPLQGKGIVNATLKWDNRGQCTRNLYQPSLPWPAYLPFINFAVADGDKVMTWPANSSGPGEVDVSMTLRRWMDGEDPNHGWLFVGADESFANHAWKKGGSLGVGRIGSGLEGTHECRSSVKGVKLVVLYTD